MIVDGVSFLLYGKVAYIMDFEDEESLKLHLTLPTLNFLHERGVEKLSYGSGERYIRIDTVLAEYNGGEV